MKRPTIQRDSYEHKILLFIKSTIWENRERAIYRGWYTIVPLSFNTIYNHFRQKDSVHLTLEELNSERYNFLLLLNSMEVKKLITSKGGDYYLREEAIEEIELLKSTPFERWVRNFMSNFHDSDGDPYAKIREKIISLRHKSNLSQKEVATCLGMGRLAYLGIENGPRKIFALELQRIAEFYGIKFQDFLPEGNQNENQN